MSSADLPKIKEGGEKKKSSKASKPDAGDVAKPKPSTAEPAPPKSGAPKKSGRKISEFKTKDVDLVSI